MAIPIRVPNDCGILSAFDGMGWSLYQEERSNGNGRDLFQVFTNGPAESILMSYGRRIIIYYLMPKIKNNRSPLAVLAAKEEVMEGGLIPAFNNGEAKIRFDKMVFNKRRLALYQISSALSIRSIDYKMMDEIVVNCFEPNLKTSRLEDAFFMS